MNKNSKVVILAGGYDQIALINEFKNRNYFTILIDYYSNPPAKDYADIHYQVSTLDIDEIKKIAIKEDVDLITTACTDQALLSVSKVSEELNLPCYLSYETALKVTNKMYMKNEMIKSGIPTAKYKVISNDSEIDFEGFNYPFVVKPCDCNSSKGVKKIYSVEDGIINIQEALSLSRSQTAIIEEFIEGQEISIDAFIKEGKSEIVLVTESEKIKNTIGFTITQSKYPVSITEENIGKIEAIVQSICDNFQLNNGPLLIQMLVCDDNVYVIEFSARMGGGTKYKLIEVLTGFNIMKAYVDLVIGEKPEIKFTQKFNYAHLNYCYAENGIFEKLDGFRELEAQSVIYDFFKYKTEGSLIDKSETSGDRVAGYLIVADCKEELKGKEQMANDILKIISTDGKDIMRHDLV